MKYSKEQLIAISENTGFRIEILEKVFLLMDLLEIFFADPILKQVLVLKGGTALNLFYLDMPRLSVDIDLNYIGTIDRVKMLIDKELIEKRIEMLCESQGFFMRRRPQNHAGGKMICRYPSVLEHIGNLEIDLNYMYRIPLLLTKNVTSYKVGERSINDIAILDINELAAGKISALIDRTLGRDLFDTYCLVDKNIIDIERLRPIFVAYAAMSRKKDFRNFEKTKLIYEFKEINHQLLPMLSTHYLSQIGNKNAWIDTMYKTVQNFLELLFPLRKNELEFLNALLTHGEVRPEILTTNLQLQNNIKMHPAILWNAYKFKHSRLQPHK